jgi:hypothetical protein
MRDSTNRESIPAKSRATLSEMMLPHPPFLPRLALYGFSASSLAYTEFTGIQCPSRTRRRHFIGRSIRRSLFQGPPGESDARFASARLDSSLARSLIHSLIHYSCARAPPGISYADCKLCRQLVSSHACHDFFSSPFCPFCPFCPFSPGLLLGFARRCYTFFRLDRTLGQESLDNGNVTY